MALVSGGASRVLWGGHTVGFAPDAGRIMTSSKSPKTKRRGRRVFAPIMKMASGSTR